MSADTGGTTGDSGAGGDAPAASLGSTVDGAGGTRSGPESAGPGRGEHARSIDGQVPVYEMVDPRPTESAELADSAEPRGTVTVIDARMFESDVHGPGLLGVALDGKELSPEQLADVVQEHPSWTDGPGAVYFDNDLGTLPYSADGRTPGPYAQLLADALGRDVVTNLPASEDPDADPAELGLITYSPRRR